MTVCQTVKRFGLPLRQPHRASGKILD